MIDTGALTDVFLDSMSLALDTAGFSATLVGDGTAPAEGGWVAGQPGSGLFRPYVVLVSGGAAPRWQTPASYTPCWAVAFSLRSYGGSRPQCDLMATAARGCADAMGKTEFASWKVVNVEWGSLGATTRVDAASPPFWQAFDMVTLVCDT